MRKKGIIGKKLGMTQVYNENGELVPVTVVEAGPCPVLDVRDQQKDGYCALQLGLGTKKVKNTAQPLQGHFKKSGFTDNPPAVIAEVRTEEPPQPGVGDQIQSDVFESGEYVDVTGITKGKGFQGVVKRHGFSGGRETHGRGWRRKPGSIGMCEEPGRVMKGKKMPGRAGGKKETVQNLEVVQIKAEENLILVKGAVPGPKDGTVMMYDAVKK